jgi:hypothetical protein
MNVRTTKIFGKEIIIQDEELEMPKYFKIKGVVRESSWLVLFEFCSSKRIYFIVISFSKRFYKKRYKTILSIFALMALASIGVGIWVILKKVCNDGYSGNSCENCLFFNFFI